MTLALLLIAILPPTEQTGVVTDSVAVIELNKVYDDSAKPILDQWIFHERTDSGFRIRAWRLDRGTTIQRHPSGDYMLMWHDGNTLRQVRARVYRETHTQYDVELRERSIYAKDQRAELSKPRDEKPDELDLIFP